MSVKRRTLLVEIGSEELPLDAQRVLAPALREAFTRELQALHFSGFHCREYVTPRRLAVAVSELEEKQPPQEQLRIGPAVTVAYDAQGEATAAARGFARSCGVALSSLETVTAAGKSANDKRLAHRMTTPGQPVAALLPALLQRIIPGLPTIRHMRWGEGKYSFVRPVHWLVVLWGEEVIPCEIFGVFANCYSRGHRFYSTAPVLLDRAEQYEEILQQHHVQIDAVKRRQYIMQEVNRQAQDLGGEAVFSEEMLAEVVALVEYPVVMAGKIPAEFLSLPEEILIATLQQHQRYFPLRDEKGLLPYFLFVSNIAPANPQIVIRGNERVVLPRLRDAQFFYQRDCAQGLELWRTRLSGLILHGEQSAQETTPSVAKARAIMSKEAGSMYHKTARMEQLLPELCSLDPLLLQRTAHLYKNDLLSEMVGEFPSLQGVMGQYYARVLGEDEAVAMAIREQYLPRFAEDELPASELGQALAIGDRLDTLVARFLVGEIPKSDSDPFALRRAALGVLRIIIERKLNIDLYQLLDSVIATFPQAIWQVVEKQQLRQQLWHFLMDRLRFWLHARELRADSVTAVLAMMFTRPQEIYQRVLAVEAFREQPAAENLIAANKRICNILKKTGSVELQRNVTLLEPVEQQLLTALETAEKDISPLVEKREYTQILQRLGQLRNPIDDFFDQVMVLCEDQEKRNHRLALLQRIKELFSQVADVSQLQQNKSTTSMPQENKQVNSNVGVCADT